MKVVVEALAEAVVVVVTFVEAVLVNLGSYQGSIILGSMIKRLSAMFTNITVNMKACPLQASVFTVVLIAVSSAERTFVDDICVSLGTRTEWEIVPAAAAVTEVCTGTRISRRRGVCCRWDHHHSKGDAKVVMSKSRIGLHDSTAA